MLPQLEPYCGGFLCTYVDKEGMMQGTDLDWFARLRAATPHEITAAGGITTLDDVAHLPGSTFTPRSAWPSTRAGSIWRNWLSSIPKRNRNNLFIVSRDDVAVGVRRMRPVDRAQFAAVPGMEVGLISWVRLISL